MTTSGTYNFTVTRDDIIRQALLNIGVLDAAEVPEAVVTQDCARVLNMICKQMMGRSDYATGLKVWTQRRGHLFLSGTTNQYAVGPTAVGWTEDYVSSTVSSVGSASGFTTVTVPATSGFTQGMRIAIETTGGSSGGDTLAWSTITDVASASGGSLLTLSGAVSGIITGGVVYAYTTAAQQPLTIEAAVLRNENNEDTPLRLMTQATYDLLPGKAAPATSAGDPTAIYYEFQLGNSYLYTDVGSCNNMQRHIVLTYMQPVQDFNSTLDNPYYPAEYYLALCWALSKEIASMFHATWTPLMQENWQNAMTVARNKDPETVDMYFQPGVE